METTLEHTIALIHVYQQLLESKGIVFPVPTDLELQALQPWEARRILKEMVDLARTPTS